MPDALFCILMRYVKFLCVICSESVWSIDGNCDKIKLKLEKF